MKAVVAIAAIALLAGCATPQPDSKSAAPAADKKADDAAKAKCRGVFWVGDVVFPESPGWMEQARDRIAKTTPPKRP